MARTSTNRQREIESWFHDHEDGEFAVLPAEHPSTVVGDRVVSRTVIYTTKLHCLVQNVEAFSVARPVMMLGRCGLPLPSDLIHLAEFAIDASCHFVGDADPPDVLAFAWLREHVAIGWLGVNDALLNGAQNSENAPTALSMSAAERAAMEVLPVLCPDFRELLGPYCSSVLDRGFKIELETAMMSRRSRLGD